MVEERDGEGGKEEGIRKNTAVTVSLGKEGDTELTPRWWQPVPKVDS